MSGPRVFFGAVSLLFLLRVFSEEMPSSLEGGWIRILLSGRVSSGALLDFGGFLVASAMNDTRETSALVKGFCARTCG